MLKKGFVRSVNTVVTTVCHDKTTGYHLVSMKAGDLCYKPRAQQLSDLRQLNHCL